MKAPRQAHQGKYVAWVLLACGCAVYDPALLNDRLSTSVGGAAGHESAGGRGNGTAGASASSGNNTGNAAGAPSDTGVAGVGGTVAVGGESGSGSIASAGAGGPDDGGTCVAETLAEFCKRVGKDCGTVAGTNNCGAAISAANCGSCQGFKMCGGGPQDNVCGSLTDPASGGVATASSVGSIGENGSKAFDADANSKWFAGDASNTGWLAYQFPGTTSHVLTSYSITSANDVPGRDPADWQLQGSNDGVKWVTVDQRSAQVFAARHQTTSYTCSAAIAFRWFRLLVTANAGAPALQIAELVLYGD